MAKDITIVTACTGSRDRLRDDQVKGNGRWVAFVDQFAKSEAWEQHSACKLFASSRRNSRIHKLLIHQYVETEYSLWMDANMSILVPPEELIDAWLGDHDIAMFKHRRRTCLFEEGKICAAQGAGFNINRIEPGKFDHPFFDATHRSPGLEPWGAGGVDPESRERETLLALC